MGFYDETWYKLQRTHPQIARKIEELRCEVVLFEQYEEKVKELTKRIERLETMNGDSG